MNKEKIMKSVKTLKCLDSELVFEKLNDFFSKNYKGNFVSSTKNKEIKFEGVIEIKAMLSTKIVDTIKIFRFSVLKLNTNDNYIELNFGLGEDHWAKTRLYLTGKENPILMYRSMPIKLLD